MTSGTLVLALVLALVAFAAGWMRGQLDGRRSLHAEIAAVLDAYDAAAELPTYRPDVAVAVLALGGPRSWPYPDRAVRGMQAGARVRDLSQRARDLALVLEAEGRGPARSSEVMP